jgi:putative endonuclease
MANHPPYKYHDIGIAGEDLVVQWLQSQGWLILHRRWRCRLGEIDIIAQMSCSPSPTLATVVFVEVKTRSQGNWDAGGRSAIATKKQAKLWRTACLFLTQNPEKANYSCRFDVALVYYEPLEQIDTMTSTPEVLGTFSGDKYQFTLEEYICGAFDS